MVTFDWNKDVRQELPNDEYKVQILKLELKKATKSDSMIANYHVKVTEGPLSGRIGFVSITLVEAAMWKLGALLSACNVKKPEGSTTFTYGTDAFNSLLKAPLGKVFMLKIEDDPKNAAYKKQSFRKAVVVGAVESDAPWEE